MSRVRSMLCAHAYGVSESEFRAAGVADPRAAVQELADGGLSIRFRDEDGERRWWFAATAPVGAGVVVPTGWGRAA